MSVLAGTVAVILPASRAEDPSRRRIATQAGADALALVAAVAVGAAFAGLFAWHSGAPDPSGVTFGGIALHNLAVAAMIIVGTAYVALPVLVANGLFLGFVVAANVSAEGWSATLPVVWPHVPLEAAAWVLTLGAARLLQPTLVGLLRGRLTRPPRSVAVVLALTVLLYLAAAYAEWWELTSVLTKG